MTTTARRQTRRIAADSTVFAALVVLGILEDFAICDLCELPAVELFTRIDNRDDAEIGICELCADSADVRCDA